MAKLTADSFKNLVSHTVNADSVASELTDIIAAIYTQIESVTGVTATGTDAENSVVYRAVSRYFLARVEYSNSQKMGRPVSQIPFLGLTNGEKDELRRDFDSAAKNSRFYPATINWHR